MCTHYRNIKNAYTGRYVLVPCGHCKSCLQEKAYKRTRRIDLQTKYDLSDDITTLFVTLTYENDCIPYIKLSEWYNFLNGEIDVLPLYRDYNKYNLRQKDNHGKRVYSKKAKKNTKLLDYIGSEYLDDKFLTQTSSFDLETIRYTKNFNGKKFFTHDSEKVGVLYYRDIQNFIKRLRINIKRSKNDYKLDFFVVGEYGPTSKRPHFHLLITIPKRFVAVTKSAIIKAWKYDNIDRFPRQIEIVTGDASNYVSSYVNCNNSISPVLQNFKPFKPMHHYSQTFGMAAKFTTLPKILASAKIGNFGYKRDTKINGVPAVVVSPIPSYVISRYFPKFKGFTRIAPSRLLDILQNPQRLQAYKYLDYTSDDLHKISVCIRNKYFKFCNELSLKPCETNLYYFASVYASIWTKYYSFLIKFAYENIKSEEDLIYHFDNWYSKRYVHEIVRNILKDRDIKTFQLDFNKFPSTVTKDFRLLEAFNTYDKAHKVKNAIYSDETNM